MTTPKIFLSFISAFLCTLALFSTTADLLFSFQKEKQLPTMPKFYFLYFLPPERDCLLFSLMQGEKHIVEKSSDWPILGEVFHLPSQWSWALEHGNLCGNHMNSWSFHSGVEKNNSLQKVSMIPQKRNHIGWIKQQLTISMRKRISTDFICISSFRVNQKKNIYQCLLLPKLGQNHQGSKNCKFVQ